VHFVGLYCNGRYKQHKILYKYIHVIFNFNILSVAFSIYYSLLACGWFLYFFYCWINQLNLEWSTGVKLGLVRQVKAFGKSPEVGIMYWKCRTDCTSSVFIFMFNSTAVCPEFNSYSLELNQHAHIVELIFVSKYQRCVTCLCVIMVIAYLQKRVIKWIRYVRTQASSSYFQKKGLPSFFLPMNIGFELHSCSCDLQIFLFRRTSYIHQFRSLQNYS